MTRRLPILLAALSVVAAACSDVPHAEFEPPEGFVPYVADSNDNVGLGNDIAVDAEGVPYVSYFGFEAQLEEGEIPTARPVGSPFIPAVQVASVAEDGAWTQGAVAQAREFSNVPVPFGPSVVESLKSLGPDNANGTSIAVSESGARHVVWASNNGVWYAESSDSSSVAQVSKFGTTLNVAGALGRPAVAVDGETPWVAWTAEARGGHEVRVATPAGDGWQQQVVARVECGGCPPPAPTGIGVTSSGPLVVYADLAAGSVMAARQQGAGWASETVASGVSGTGLALDVDGEGTARVSYFANGTVELATSEGASWSTAEVGEAGQPEDRPGNFAPTTDVTADPDGVPYVTWYDAQADVVRLARGADGGFEEIETVGTEGGRFPSVAAGPEGRVFLAWYDTLTEDLLVGVLGGSGDLVLARPSPTPEGAIPEPPATDCGADGEILLEISAENIAFSTNCLVAPAGEAFTITFENLEADPHNIAIYPGADPAPDDQIAGTPIEAGPQTQTLDADPLDPESYFFRCDAHPLQMTGTLAVVEG